MNAITNPRPVDPHRRDAIVRALGKLPQSSLIPEERKVIWAQRMLSDGLTVPEIAWHLRRLMGWGGSDIGTLVAGRRGEFTPFNTPRDLVAEKLLLAPPRPETADIRRGRWAEPHARQMLHARLGAEQDGAAMARLSSMTGIPGMPWVVTNPDDILLLPGDVRAIADYKAPGPDNIGAYLNGDVPFSNICQLHYYMMADQAIGGHVDQLMIGAFNVLDPDCVPVPVEIDPALVIEIQEAGAYYWEEFVLKGNLPKSARKPTIDLQAIPQRLFTVADELVSLKALATVATDRADLLASEIKKEIAALGQMGARKAMLGMITVKGKRAVDEAGLEARLASVGLTPDEYRLPAEKVNTEEAIQLLTGLVERVQACAGSPAALTALARDLQDLKLPMVKGAFDVERAAEALVEAGADPAPYIDEETLTCSLPGGNKGPLVESWRTSKEAIVPYVDNAVSQYLDGYVHAAPADETEGIETP